MHGLSSETYDRAILRMAFHLTKERTIIEFDGHQHFEPVRFGNMADEQALLALERTKKNYLRKNKWAKNNDYKMIRVKFSESVNERLNKELVII